MSTNRTVDVRVRDAFPQPIAAAWHRAFTTTGDVERVKQLLACFEITLRTVASFVVLDYVRGARSAVMEAALTNLDKPSAGHWVGLIREGLRAIRDRDGPEPFFPEAIAGYFDAKGKPTAAARRIDELVALRNRDAHDTPSPSKTVAAGNAATILGELRSILATLAWLSGYRLFCVQRMDRARGRKERYRGYASFYVGRDAVPVPTSIDVGTSLIPDAMYLADPSGERLLEVTPFLRIDFDDKLNQEHLFVFGGTRRSKQLVLINDSTGTAVRDTVPSFDGNVSFERWLALDDHSPLVLENPLPAGLAAPDAGKESELRCGDGRRFEVRALLGRGGMATVHLVWDDFDEQELALKVLSDDLSKDESCRERFRREGRTMRRVRHPNVLRVNNVGQLEDGRLWLTMPVVSGGNLRERMDSARTTEDQARAWMRQMLAALTALHGRRPPIVHRDIKPSNFLLDDQGTVLLADFGIALQGDQARITRTKEQLGSTAYMSPEQRSGGEVAASSDVYSLGLVLHQLLTGDDVVATPGKGVAGPLGEMVRAMTHPQPGQRPTARSLAPGGPRSGRGGRLRKSHRGARAGSGAQARA